MNPIIAVENVSQSFRVGFWLKKTPVLHDVTLNVPKGSIFGFLGANGAGKTTLIHLIVGLRKPVSGTVRIEGKDAALPSARSRVGYLPERPYFHEHLTGEQMLRYFGLLSGMSSSDIEKRIPEVLGEVGLLNRGGKEPRKLELKRYSKGMLQRIGIAQALLHDPDLLVLDEPMSGLDPLGRRDIRDLMLRLSNRGKTIFFSTHIIPDVEAVCTDVGLIEKGRITGCGSIVDLLRKKVGRTEIAFSGLSDTEVRDLGIATLQTPVSVPGGFRGSVENEDSVQEVLKVLLAKRARIQSVTPVRSSLEELFQ